MANKLIGGLFGGGKKRKAATPVAAVDPKGPIVKPLGQDTALLEKLKKKPALGVAAAFGGGDTILSDKLGG